LSAPLRGIPSFFPGFASFVTAAILAFLLHFATWQQTSGDLAESSLPPRNTDYPDDLASVPGAGLLAGLLLKGTYEPGSRRTWDLFQQGTQTGDGIAARGLVAVFGWAADTAKGYLRAGAHGTIQPRTPQ
jgi:hypothetical protein